MPFVEGAIGNNVALEINKFDQPGSKLIEIENKADVAAILAFQRKDGTTHPMPGDSKHDDEPVFDGDSLINTPVKPGSVAVVVTGLSDLLDKYLDGLLYLDRLAGSVLSSGTNGATANKTLTAAGENFTTDEVVAGDLLVLADSPDQGSYTVVTPGTTTVVVDRAFPVGGQTGVTYSVIAKEKVAGRLDYFTGEFNLDYPSNIAPTGKASLVGTVAFPINLAPADILTANVDAGGTQNAQFDAGRAECPGDQGGSLAASDSETLVLSIQGGENQEIDFGAGTETTAALYAAVIDAAISGGQAIAETDSLTAMIGSLNQMKASYVAHGASATIHAVADAVNLITAADASDQATSETLANDLKAIYNAHRTQATVHINDDATNIVTAPNATNLPTLVTLVADLKVQLNAHYAMESRLGEAITFANDVAAMYEAHRILTAGPVHGAADSTNVITAPTATNLATCMALANDTKAMYEAHRILIAGTVHGNFDSIDAITAPDATDLTSLKTLLVDIAAQYAAHRVHTGANATGPFAGCAFTDQGGDVCRLTDSSNPFTSDDVGKNIVIANSTSAGNDGTFVITAAAAGYVEYTNASLVAEAFAAATTGTIAAVHANADATNVVSAPAIDTAAVHLIADTNTITASPDCVNIYADQYGTGSSVEVVSGTGTILAKLGFAVGTYTGTGDVANIDAVTFAEAKALIEEDIKTAVAGDKIVCSLDETGFLRITNTTANEGANSTLEMSGLARTKFGLDALVHAGDDPDASLGALVDYISTTSYPANSRSQIRMPHGPSAGDVYCYGAGDSGSGTVRLTF